MSSRYRSQFLGALGVTLLAASGVSYAAGGELLKSEPKLLFGTSFEAGSLSDWNISGNAPELTRERVRAGSSAIKSYLHRYDSRVSYRTEIRRPGNDAMGKEYWYGFSIMLPSPYPDDTIGDTVAQWHSTPDEGEEHQNPPMGLHIKDGRWKFLTRWNTSQPTVKSAQQGTTLDLGSHQRDKWTDWVVRVKWSYGSDGLLQVWKDGVQVVNRTGPNTYRDERGPYFKIGIYKPEWKRDVAGSVTQRVLYHDEVRVAGDEGSYDAVAPGGSTRPIPPVLSIATPSS